MATHIIGSDDRIYLRAADNKHQAGSVAASAISGSAAAPTVTMPAGAGASVDAPDFSGLDDEGSAQPRKLTAEEKLAEAEDMLVASVMEIKTSEDFMAALDFAAKLHNYSVTNTMLMAAQHRGRMAADPDTPADPGPFKSFNAWKSAGRTVKKGAKGYQVLVPVKTSGRYYTDASGQAVFLKKGEKPPAGEKVEYAQGKLRGFKVGHTFPAYLTEGDPIPEHPRPALLVGGGIDGVTEKVTELAEGLGFAVEYVDPEELDGANGVMDPVKKTIRVRDDVDEHMRQRVLVHEYAHAVLHSGEGFDYHGHRGFAETQAEAAAYMTMRALNPDYDTSDYSVPYVAGWSSSMSGKEIRKALNGVGQVAKNVLAAFEPQPEAEEA